MSMCIAARSPTEPYAKCHFKANSDQKYCSIHASYSNPTICLATASNPDPQPNIFCDKSILIPNPIFFSKIIEPVIPKAPVEKISNKTRTLKEQQTKTIIDNY